MIDPNTETLISLTDAAREAALDYARRGWGVLPLWRRRNGVGGCRKGNCRRTAHATYQTSDERSTIQGRTSATDILPAAGRESHWTGRRCGGKMLGATDAHGDER